MTGTTGWPTSPISSVATTGSADGKPASPELLRGQAPERLWLWGIDIQFGAYIDEAQRQYFADVAVNQVQPGDRIILCMAKEVESGRKQEKFIPTAMWNTSSARSSAEWCPAVAVPQKRKTLLRPL
ncbi:MAG: hypothetical protein M3143_13385 [Actinomycetota bacterium]|nr:hypothetical protein [Actinomycetota bacterium]